MKIGTIIALAAIITVVGLSGAVNTWSVSQSANAASCQEFSTNGVITTQHCSSFTSDAHSNHSNNTVHFQHTKH